jgi:hypothetical protein
LTPKQSRSRAHKLGLKLGFHESRGAKKYKRPAATTPSVIEGMQDVRRMFEQCPSDEERVGLDPVQKVHLHSFAVKQMLDARALTQGIVNSIGNVASGHYPDADRFFDLIDQMLAWKPKPNDDSSRAIDFAASARKTLAALDQNLDKAVERLTALQAMRKDRR